MSLKLVGMTVIMLMVAITVPVLIGANNNDHVTAIRLDTEQSEAIGHSLQVYADSIAANDSDNATITVTDTEELQSETNVITVGTNETYLLPGGEVEVYLSEIGDAYVDLVITHSNQYGWPAGASTIADNLEIILIAMTLLITTSFAAAGARTFGGVR